ncbi:hypothetical protein ACQPX6_16755 [Actinomycetospora sp. CA-101289]|uniref:hypothetical protein n=1 Tax=Actinomycetospora sp. CA-101289 TaxID=3239893 RepID=UPI003D96EB1F
MGLVDATTVSDLVATAGPQPVVDLSGADEVTRDALELLASLQDRERVRVVGARWPQVVAAMLAAPLGEVGRLGVLARRVVEGGVRR